MVVPALSVYGGSSQQDFLLQEGLVLTGFVLFLHELAHQLAHDL